MQAAETDKRSFGAIVVRELVGAIGVGDVDLNDDQVGRVIDFQRFHMFIHDDRAVVGR